MRIWVGNNALIHGKNKKKGKDVTSMSSPLGDYTNRYLLPGKPGSSVVLGRELALFVGEGEECS